MGLGLSLEADTGVDQPAHLLLEPLGVAPLPSPGPWVQSNLPHEVVEAVAKSNVAALLSLRLRHQPEEKQPGDRAIGVHGFPGLPVDVGLDYERQIAVCARPDRRVAWVAVRQGALHELTRHKRRLGRVRVLFNLHGGIQQELVCGTGKLGFGSRQFDDLGFLVFHVCMKACKHEITHGRKSI